MIQKAAHNAVSISFDSCVDEIITKVATADPEVISRQSEHRVDDYELFDALWDTGATISAISSAVVQRCGLVKYGENRIDTSSDRDVDVDTYLVSLLIGVDIKIGPLEVLLLDIPGAEMMIGMDIISAGDFALSQKFGNTVLSFRSPSIGTIDFVPK